MNFLKPSKGGKSARLILLCWLVYTCTYLGKLSYSANISRIGEAFGVSYAQTGMVTTFFFFAYGLGQILNGLFCKRYNIKILVFVSIIVSATMNVTVALIPEFSFIKYAWLINGVTTSFLWPSLIRLLSETLAVENLSTATIAMGTTVATGTFTIYGLSSLFSTFTDYRATFITAACILCTVAAVWIFSYNGLVNPLAALRREAKSKEEITSTVGKATAKGTLRTVLVALALFAVADNLVKDGLTSWTPDILSSLYETPAWLSILLTLLLPLLAIFGVRVATKIQKHTDNFIGTCTLLFGGSAVLVGMVILLLKTSLISVTIGCFAVVSCLMSGVNNVITSIMPLNLRDKINPGKVAGIMNGFCYLGSTISAYGLGSFADAFGWESVFTLLFSITLGASVIGGVYWLVSAISKNHGKTS